MPKPYALSALAMLLLTNCDRAPAIERDEVPHPRENQGAPAAGRTKTADTDADQLVMLPVLVDGTVEPDVVEVAQGPLVVTSISGTPTVHLSMSGVCPPYEAFTVEQGYYEYPHVHPEHTTFVPTGAALCGVHFVSGTFYTYRINGYVPYD